MPQSHGRIILHVVFSTFRRVPMIPERLRAPLHGYLATVIGDCGCVPIVVGGVADHVHLLFGLGRDRAPSDVVNKVKTASTKWVKARNGATADDRDFRWLEGYGVFSLGQSQLDDAVAYVRAQEQHDRRATFQEEYARFLESYRVEHDPARLWDE